MKTILDRSGYGNFVVNFTNSPIREFGIYARAYTNAANSLSSKLLGQARFLDYDAYPIPFLYRHALELSLKNIIFKSHLLNALQNRPNEYEALKATHKLPPLANIAAAVLNKAFPDDEWLKSRLLTLNQIAGELSEIDPESYSFRYPVDKRGNPSTRHHLILSVAVLYDEMSTLLEDLDTIDFGLNMNIGNAEDMLTEMTPILEALDHEFSHNDAPAKPSEEGEDSIEK